MNETTVTIVGNVASEPTTRQTVDGLSVASFRLASTPRRYDGQEWKDGPSLFASVHCWRGLGANAAESLRKGDPVVVTGRLSVSTWEGRDGQARVTVDVDAQAVGHDLSRGTSRFTRVARTAAGAPVVDQRGAGAGAGAGADGTVPAQPGGGEPAGTDEPVATAA